MGDKTERTMLMDFTGCQYLWDLHSVIRKTLCLRDYHENWEQLWREMEQLCGPLHVQMKGLDSLPERLSKEVATMLHVFQRVRLDRPEIVFEQTGKNQN